jgi:hypothetical protein
MPQHVRGDNLGPVRQVHLGGTRTASSRQPRRPGPPRAPPRQRAPVPGVPPRPAVEDRVRVRVDRLWRQAAPTASTRPRTDYLRGASAAQIDRIGDRLLASI